MMVEYCCRELEEFKAVNDNVWFSTYDTETKILTKQKFKHKWPFTFCPFCGVQL